MKNPHTGSSLDDYLDEEGINEQVTLDALRRILLWMLARRLVLLPSEQQRS